MVSFDGEEMKRNGEETISTPGINSSSNSDLMVRARELMYVPNKSLMINETQEMGPYAQQSLADTPLTSESFSHKHFSSKIYQ